MMKTATIAALAAAAALGLSACDVKKTQEGSASLPKYDVKKTEDGHVTPPKYDVTAPDVKVGSKQETVTVPTVDVTTAKEKEQQGRKEPDRAVEGGDRPQRAAVR